MVDSRFHASTRGAPNPHVCLHLLVQGLWRGRCPNEASFQGPDAFVLPGEAFSGAYGKRALTYRILGRAGEPCLAIELHGPPKEIRIGGATPWRVAIDEPTWNGARLALDAMSEGDESALTEGLGGVLRGLMHLGIVRPEAVRRALDPDPWIFARLWKGLRPLVERFSAVPGLDGVSSESGVSKRQAMRNVTTFLGSFGFPDGWRPFMRHVRIRLATLLLSAEGVTAAEVAAIVGYGSLAAMARAFRDESLPPPSEVQRELSEAARTETLLV